MNTYLRFETGSEERVSVEYGPFPFVQMTYGDLRVGPDGEEFAYYSPDADEWRVLKEPGAWYSDVIIYDGSDAK